MSMSAAFNYGPHTDKGNPCHIIRIQYIKGLGSLVRGECVTQHALLSHTTRERAEMPRDPQRTSPSEHIKLETSPQSPNFHTHARENTNTH